MPTNKTELLAWLDARSVRRSRRYKAERMLESEVPAFLAAHATAAKLAQFFGVKP